jgi:hypothetical protein
MQADLVAGEFGIARAPASGSAPEVRRLPRVSLDRGPMEPRAGYQDPGPDAHQGPAAEGDLTTKLVKVIFTQFLTAPWHARLVPPARCQSAPAGVTSGIRLWLTDAAGLIDDGSSTPLLKVYNRNLTV